VTIQDEHAWRASMADWAILDGCWGQTRISPSDVDGFVERNGHTLFLEHKSTPTAPVKTGQDIAYRAWAKQGNAVFVFWSENGAENVQRMRLYWQGRVADRPADLEALRTACRRWFLYAENRRAA
jgi:hypothetical protein